MHIWTQEKTKVCLYGRYWLLCQILELTLLIFNQSFWYQPIDGGGRTEEDGVVGRSILTRWGEDRASHLSEQPSNFECSRQRTQSYGGLLEATKRRRTLGRRPGSDGETAGGAFWWPCCDFGLKTSVFSPSFCETTARMDQAPSAPSPPPKPVNHEPISFGIDQILGGGTEPENGRTAGRQSGSDSSNVGDGYYSLGSPAAASAPSYTALSISLSGIMPSVEASGSYAENRSLGSRGVIRVPAHRPMTATGPPAPVQSAVTGFGGLCFPWIGNRFAKDRISGRLMLL